MVHNLSHLSWKQKINPCIFRWKFSFTMFRKVHFFCTLMPVCALRLCQFSELDEFDELSWLCMESDFNQICSWVEPMLKLRLLISHTASCDTGAYLATHESRILGTTAKFKVDGYCKTFIVYIRVIDPVDFKSDLILGLGLLLHCHIGFFCRKSWKILKN